MIAKKNSRFDLEGKRRAFFTLGLLVTGSLTLAAFTYSDPLMNNDMGRDVKRERIATTYELQEPEVKKPLESFDKPEDLPDDSQQQQIDLNQQISQLVKLTVNTQTTPKSGVDVDLGGIPTGPITTKGTITNITGDDIEDWVDQDAQFIGGFVEMTKFIVNEMEYPEMSVRAGVEGKVFISFVVEKNGDITNVTVEEGVSKELDREAQRVVRSFPKWIPGEKDAKKVRTRVRLPIVFSLQ